MYSKHSANENIQKETKNLPSPLGHHPHPPHRSPTPPEVTRATSAAARTSFSSGRFSPRHLPPRQGRLPQSPQKTHCGRPELAGEGKEALRFPKPPAVMVTPARVARSHPTLAQDAAAAGSADPARRRRPPNDT